MPGTLADADPLPMALRVLAADPDVAAALGGPGRVGGDNEPPYPRIVLTDPPGGAVVNPAWVLATSVQVEVWGDPDGTHDKWALRRVLTLALGALARLPEAPREPGDPVVTAVGFTGGAGGWSPIFGQGRYLGSATITAHPPQ